MLRDIILGFATLKVQFNVILKTNIKLNKTQARTNNIIGENTKQMKQLS